MKQLFALLVVLLTGHSMAQDVHHWSEQFGTRASLLGGAGTAGLGDNATVFYNPSAMSWVDDPNLSVTVNAYRIRVQNVRNALGDSLNLRQVRLGTYPNLIAGIIKFNDRPRLSLGYAVITKNIFGSSFDYLHQGRYDVDSSGSIEDYIASYNYTHDVLEYWAGAAISYQLNQRWSIGLGHFGIYKDVNYQNNIDVSALPDTTTADGVSRVASKIDFSYWSVKGNFKPSINFVSDHVRWGMTYTTPTFNVMGRATVFREFSTTNMGGGDALVTDRREKVKAVTKSPGSLAVGVSVRFGKKAWLHVSNEFFFGQPYYLLFDPPNPVNVYPDTISDQAVYQRFGEQNFLAYGEAYTPVLNSGIGYEVRFNDRLDMMTGIRTDLNYLRREDQYYTLQRIAIESSKWQLTHWSVGFGYNTKSRKRWTVGIEYNYVWGLKFAQFINFTEPNADNLLLGPRTQSATTRQFSMKLLLGVEFGGVNSAPMHLEEEENRKEEQREKSKEEQKEDKKDGFYHE